MDQVQQSLAEAMKEWKTTRHGGVAVWFCMFALYQPEDGHGPNISEQLNQKPFCAVIKSPHTRGMLALHTSTSDLYERCGSLPTISSLDATCRLWCLYEFDEAMYLRSR